MRWVSWVALGLLLGTAGCNACDPTNLNGDEKNPPPPPGECKPLEVTCDSMSQSFRDGKCQSTYCEDDTTCCPGTRCELAFNLCRSRLNDTPCEADADCPVKGQKCQDIAGLKACVFDRCESNTQCAEGLNCFKGRCVGENPCKGGCGPLEVCDVTTATCGPAGTHQGCDLSCPAGSLKVLKTPDTMSGLVCCEWACECSPLPPLTPGVVGLYASVTVSHLNVNVASFDTSYGDLVVSRYGRTGQLEVVDYVDGFPATGTIGGAAEGPRRGITEPGDDVGRFSSAGLDAVGRVHVAYFDKTHGALKHAVETAPHVWATHVVDPGPKAGQYASLTFRPSDGVPVISYFATALTTAGGKPASAAKVAIGKSASPAATADWDLKVLEQVADFDPCNGSCAVGFTCVLGAADGGTGPVCRANATTCTPACGGAQACVTEGSAQCLALASPPIDGQPRAMGLFTAAAAHADTIVVAYYDGVRGLLRAARVPTGAGMPTLFTLDGDGMNGRSAGDVGTHAAIASDANGKWAVVYQDNTRQELKMFSSVSLANGQYFTIDSGRGSPPGFHFLGGGASLAFGPDGTAYVVYQEQTTLDLKLGQRQPDGAWKVVDPFMDAAPAAYGFYSDIAVEGSDAYIVSVKPELGSTFLLANKLGLLIEHVPMP